MQATASERSLPGPGPASKQVAPGVHLPADVAANLPRMRLAHYGLVVRVPTHRCACGAPRVVLATEAGDMIHGGACDSCAAGHDVAACDWRPLGDPRLKLKRDLDGFARNHPDLADALAGLLADRLAPGPAAAAVPLGDVRYQPGHDRNPAGAFLAAVDAQAAGDFGVVGKLGAITLTDADWFGPALATVGARNAMALEAGVGVVRGRHPLEGEPGKFVDVLTLLGSPPSTFVRVTDGGQIFGAS